MMYPSTNDTPLKLCLCIRMYRSIQSAFFGDVCEFLHPGRVFFYTNECLRETRFFYQEAPKRMSEAVKTQNHNYATNMWRISFDQRNRKWRY